MSRGPEILTFDAHFSHLKRAIDAIPTEKWPADVDQVQDLVLGGIKHIANTATVFLSSNDLPAHGRKKLILKDIACVQRLRARRDALGGKVLTVENKVTMIRTQGCKVGDEDDSLLEPGGETELSGGCNVNIQKLCERLEKQKKKRMKYE